MVDAFPRLVGRDQEISLLLDFIDEVDRLPGGLVIEGEAGIGKTTVWSAGIEAARERSRVVLEARPTEVETDLAFAGLFDLLGGVVDRILPRLPDPQARALEIALLLQRGEGAGPDQRLIGVAFLSALRALASESAVLVAIDDVQWLDTATAATIEFAARRLRSEQVGFLLARRREPVGRLGLRLDPVLRQSRVELGPLSLGATHALLVAHTGASLSRPVLRRLHDLSGGNPLYALELGEALARRQGRLEPGEPFPVPDQLSDLIAERLALLPAETQDALTVAAAVSKATTDILAAALGGDPWKRLDPAVAARIVRVVGDRIVFTHPLLATVAYERASLRRRQEIHRILSSLVADPEERAHHLARTTEGPDARIASALEGAALRAAGRGAQDAAADLCARARIFTPAAATEAIGRLTLREAEYALQSGDTPRARAILEAFLRETPPGRSRVEALTHLARVHFNGLDWRTSVHLLEKALTEAGDDLSLRLQIEIHLAINLDLLRTDVRATWDHATAAVALAERLGDEPLLAEALMLQAKSEFLLGHGWSDPLVQRAMELQAAARVLPADRWPQDYLASMRGWTDDLAGAIALLASVEIVAREQGDEVSLNWALARLVELECYAGRWTDALQNIDRGAEIALQAGQRANEAIFLALRAMAEARLGFADTSRVAGQRAIELAEETGAKMARRTALAALGFLELSLDHPREADAYLAPLVAETRAAGVGEPGAMRFLPDAIETLIALGRPDDARALLAFLEERARSTARSSALAAAARCHGLLAAARGDLPAALAALDRALAETQPPFERARTLLALGQAQRRAKQKLPARETLQNALAIFEDLGARLCGGKARDELSRIGGRAPATSDLTPTERRVARLVAEGRSNKEVAVELFVSPKTVDVNLTRIYAKLGIHSRTELARRLAGEDRPGKL